MKTASIEKQIPSDWIDYINRCQMCPACKAGYFLGGPRGGGAAIIVMCDNCSEQFNLTIGPGRILDGTYADVAGMYGGVIGRQMFRRRICLADACEGVRKAHAAIASHYRRTHPIIAALPRAFYLLCAGVFAATVCFTTNLTALIAGFVGLAAATVLFLKTKA